MSLQENNQLIIEMAIDFEFGEGDFEKIKKSREAVEELLNFIQNREIYEN